MKRNLKYFLGGVLLVCGLSMPIQAQESAKGNVKAYIPFDLGELKPEGWIKDWAQKAANGMTKTIGIDFTEFVRGWSDPDQGGWWHYEQTGYYTDGFTRLGFLLDDTLLINRSHQVMEAVIARQKPNGYITSNNKDYIDKWGTVNGDYGQYWSEGIFCRAAIAYYSATKNESVLNMLKKVYANFPVFTYNNQKPFYGGDLLYMRKLSGLENMFELSRITGDESFANRALEVLKNYEPAYIDTWARKKEFLRTAICHGVSYNEAAKIPAIAYIWNNNPEYLAASANSFEFMQENSMLPIGANSSNEYLQGIRAFESAESCDVSDFLWSNIWMARATGQSKYGDRIERDIYNALPGAVNPSFTQCVYNQVPNRIPGFHLFSGESGNFYKEMHWPTCCPANINRALPNFIMNMAMKNGNGEILWLAYGPAHLKTRDGKYDIKCETEYPFRDSLTFTLNAVPQKQVLKFRIPTWCTNPSLAINGKSVEFKIEENAIKLNNKWKAGDKIVLVFPMKAELVKGNEMVPYYNGKRAPYWGMMAGSNSNTVLDGFKPQGRCAWVNYGPLLFAMSMQRDNRDYFDNNEELWTEFRYALTPESLNNYEIEYSKVKRPFMWHYKDAPLTISAKASLVDWNPDKSDATMPLNAPATLKSDINIKLVPYGCLAYRISMFPLVGE